jgi:hypothetical protein
MLQTLQSKEKQLAGQYQIHNLAFCHLKLGKLVSAVKPMWYVNNNSILEQIWLLSFFSKFASIKKLAYIISPLDIDVYIKKKNALVLLPNEILSFI